MNKRTLLALGIAAAAGAVALRRLGLRETLDWDAVPKPGRLIDIDGYRVHYVEQGAGPAIVLVHGFGGQTANYAQLMPLLAADHRVIAVDLKGYGYSERDASAGLSATDQVTMLRGVLGRLGVERAVFVGHSMGGGIVQRFAATYPDAVEALVLMASVSGEERLADTCRRRAVAAGAGCSPTPSPRASMAASRPVDPTPTCARSTCARPHPARRRLLAMARDARRDLPIDASAITMPVLLLYGAEDRVVPLSFAERIRRRIPQARLVVIDRTAHMLLVERPRECADAIASFLHDVTASTSAPAGSSWAGL
jgi:pimeloyl-ACP methyl ester carboxylesterase